MTREQEITTMGAHAARTTETGPTTPAASPAITTAARIATTTLAVAVTGVVGSGTALAHDDGAGQHGGHGHHAATVTSPSSENPADEARAEAQQTVRDTLADLGLPFSDSESDDQQDSSDAQDPWSDEHDSSGSHDGHDGHEGDAGSHPSSGASSSGASSSGASASEAPAAQAPGPSVQPIAASSGISQLPPVGETRTVPIR